MFAFSWQQQLIVTVLIGLLWGIFLGDVKIRTGKLGDWLRDKAPIIALIIAGFIILTLVLMIINLNFTLIFTIISFTAFLVFIGFLFFKLHSSSNSKSSSKNSKKKGLNTKRSS